MSRNIRNGYGATSRINNNNWSYSITHCRKNMSSSVASWLSGVDSLNFIIDRLKQVQIENLDAIACIQKYDTKDTLHYLDPPYVQSTRQTKDIYLHEFDNQKHLTLLSLVKQLCGKVIISGYDNDLYNAELKDWCVIKQKPKIAPITISSKSNGFLRQEVIWANFNINT